MQSTGNRKQLHVLAYFLHTYLWTDYTRQEQPFGQSTDRLSTHSDQCDVDAVVTSVRGIFRQFLIFCRKILCSEKKSLMWGEKKNEVPYSDCHNVLVVSLSKFQTISSAKWNIEMKSFWFSAFVLKMASSKFWINSVQCSAYEHYLNNNRHPDAHHVIDLVLRSFINEKTNTKTMDASSLHILSFTSCRLSALSCKLTKVFGVTDQNRKCKWKTIRSWPNTLVRKSTETRQSSTRLAVARQYRESVDECSRENRGEHFNQTDFTRTVSFGEALVIVWGNFPA